MSDKYQRVNAYLDRRDRARGLDVEMIHCFDAGGEDPGFPLLQSDLRALLADLDAAVGALEGVLKIERGSSGRIILEGWQEEVIKATLSQIKAAGRGQA